MAKPKETILLAVHPLAYQGARRFPDWEDLVGFLRERLRRTAIELPGSTRLLLLFSFNHPRTALACVSEIFAAIRRIFRTDKHPEAPLPIQVVVHVRRRDGGGEPFLDPNADIWTRLAPGAIHITSALRYRWEALMADHDLPPHHFEQAAPSIFRLELAGGATITAPRLFPHRHLLHKGSHKPCFYCGTRHHPPGGCPSRLLGPQPYALSLLGHMPTAEIGRHLQQALADPKPYIARIKGGVHPHDLRHDPVLAAYVGYFDCFRIFQLRFLMATAFTPGSRWTVACGERLKIDNHNLHAGLDCLRVGNHGKAEEFFQKEYGKTSGKHALALIGLALTSLERGRTQDMATYLDRARSMAQTERERIYAGLLLGRYHLLVAADYYKAKETAELVRKARPDCPDGRYLDILVEVQKRVEVHTLEALRKLLRDEPEFFLTAMLDPFLLPVEGFVEEMQHGLLADLQRRAAHALAEARDACEDLADWLPAGDDRLAEQQRTVKSLEDEHQQRSYYGLLEVESMANGVTQGCQRIVREVLAERRKRLREAIGRYDRLLASWKQYPYQVFFRRCVHLLHESRALLSEAQAALEQEKGKEFRRAGELIDQAARCLDAFADKEKAMRWFQAAMESGRIFGLRLLVCEIAVGAACVLLFALAPHLPLPHPLARLADDHLLRRQVTIIAMLVLGPVFASLLTLTRLQDR